MEDGGTWMDLEEVDLAWWVTVPNFGEELGKLIFDSFDQGCVCVCHLLFKRSSTSSK